MIFVEEDRVIPNHASITIFNSDGDEVDACGNGSRCVAKILCDKTKTEHAVIGAWYNRGTSASKWGSF